MNHYAINAGKELLAALGIDPVYVIDVADPFRSYTSAEWQFVYDDGDGCGIAFTAPTLDALLHQTLQYEWKGRGFCVVLQASVYSMSEAETLGVLLHEAAHYVAAYDHPERDAPDIARAAKAGWHSTQTEREAHDKQWLRATIHLWHRACRMGCEISLSDVVNLEQYGFSRRDLGPVLDEASSREGEDIETILASRLPSTSAPRRKRRGPRRWSAMIAGRHVVTAGGRTTIDGREVSERAFRNFLRCGRRERDVLFPKFL